MYHEDIKELTKENTNYRNVLYTGKYSQIVAMRLKPGEEIGEEIHDFIDQIFFIVEGEGEAVVGRETFGFDKHDVIFVPSSTKHNIKNASDKDLKLYTVYSPPAHHSDTVNKTKEEADSCEW